MRFCGSCGFAFDSEHDPLGAGRGHGSVQRRYLTVMFCDLVDSTPLAESLDPEDFREVLSGFQRACSCAIERFEGYTAKYVGDGLVAYFGYPKAHEDDALRAVHAGLGILEELTVLNAHLGQDRGISLQVRVGLHTGLVVAGEMGAGETREELAIVGDTPHIAARVESSAPPGSVVISDATHDLVAGQVRTEPLGATALKGLSRRVSIHRVISPRAAHDALDLGRARGTIPIVGRDRQLARLEEAWRRAKSGTGTVAYVSGEAGIGKSHLVCALRNRLRGELSAQHVWKCSAHHASTALHPVARFLEHRLGLSATDTTEHQLQVLREAALGGGLDPDEAVPPLADTLAVSRGRDHARHELTPRDARNSTLRILTSLLVTNPAHHPLLLVVEDLHWADPTTLELLARIMPAIRRIPVLCILTARADFKPPWPHQPADIEIELGPLSSCEVRALALAASKATLDPAVLDRVDAAADGVPLFVAEIVRMLELGGDEALGRANATVVPPTLQGLLTERLDRLPDLGDVIDAAAVAGREFEQPLLEALRPQGESDIHPALERLAAQNILRPVRGTRSRWEFTHALLQQAAYERLVRQRRQAIHARMAETLVRRFAPVAEATPEVIARHWWCAGEPAKATPYWHAAGTYALERAAFVEAAEHFRRGLESLDEADPGGGGDLLRADFLTHLGASLQAGRGYTACGVADTYAKARGACERAGNHERLVSVIRGQWLFYLLRAEYEIALELSSQMMALGWRGGGGALFAEGNLFAGLVRMYTGDFVRSRAHLREALACYQRHDRSDHIYEAQGDTGVMARAYLAPVLWYMGDIEESRECSELSLELVEEVGGPVTRAQAWGMRSMLHLVRAEPVETSHWAKKTLAYSEEHNIGYWRTVASLLLGWLQGRAGDLEAGAARVQDALVAYRRSRSKLSLPLFFLLLADLRLVASDTPRALEALGAAERHIDSTGERLSQSEVFRLRGRALMTGASPDPQGAEAAFERAVRVAREQQAKLLELRAATTLALHQRLIGKSCTVLEHLASLSSAFPTATQDPDIVRARELLAGELTAL